MSQPISRRAAIARLSSLAAITGVPLSFAAASEQVEETAFVMQSPPPVTVPGYGTDPDLIHPNVPWPLTLDEGQRQLLTILADILIPADEHSPQASDVGVVEVLDEWMSAPYPTQQSHRAILLSGFAWIDAESERLNGKSFTAAAPEARIALVDRIAFPERVSSERLRKPAEFFALLRSLVAGAFYSSPEGARDLGYLGNVPIAGDYPGPSEAALTHLRTQLEELGLS